MGHDETRGKAASDSPKPAEEGTDPVSELADLHSAFDSIDDTMKDVARREVMVTPETLEQIVNDAVAKAITAYEQSRTATPEASAAPPGGAASPNKARDVARRQPTDPAAVPLSAWREKLERLQGDLGIDEIVFDSAAAAEPAENVAHHTLSAEMGVHDFEFDDAPGAAAGPAAEPAASVPLDIDAVTEWMATTAAASDVDQVRSSVTGTAKAGETDQQFDWVAAELAELDAAAARKTDRRAAPPPDPEPPPYEAPEPVAPAIEQPPVAVAPAIEPPLAAYKPEVRETRRGLAGWFRSALGDRSPRREPAAVPAPGRATPPILADSVAPQPEPAAPAREPAAALKPMTPEEPADTVRFTFDPIPPVPPPLPSEPNEPRKKINKFGRFL